MKHTVSLVTLLLALAAPVAVQTPVGHPGDAVRFEQELDVAHDWTHHYVCFDAEVLCERIEKSSGFVDAATPPNHVSYSRRLPAELTDGPHRILVWAYNCVGDQCANAGTEFDFTYSSQPPPAPPAAGVPHQAERIRIWRPL